MSSHDSLHWPNNECCRLYCTAYEPKHVMCLQQVCARQEPPCAIPRRDQWSARDLKPETGVPSDVQDRSQTTDCLVAKISLGALNSFTYRYQHVHAEKLFGGNVCLLGGMHPSCIVIPIHSL